MAIIEAAATIVIDPVSTKAETGELAKYAVPLGYTLEISASDVLESGRLVFRRAKMTPLSHEIKNMVLLLAVAEDVSPETVLRWVTRDLGKMHVDTTNRPSDIRGIGEGHVEGQ